jgi:starch synthase
MDLIHHAIFSAVGRSWLLLGDAFHHNGINSHLWYLKHYLDDNQDCHLEIG